MVNYLKESIDKFKKDALSKLVYDILKWLIPSIGIFSLSKLASKDTTFSSIILHRFDISLYTIVILITITIATTAVLMNVLFNKKYKKLEVDNFTDELTGLKNYKSLREYTSNKINEFNQNKNQLSIILIDVDNFKDFNTKNGYNTADKILKAVGELLGKDKRATDEVFRQFLRGDEFLVVASETSSDNAFKAAERKRKLIENTTFTIDGKNYKLTVSCGVTELKTDDNYTTFTNRAHSALIEAKSQPYKNCSKLFY